MVQVACKKFKHPVTNLVTFFKDNRIVLVYQQIIFDNERKEKLFDSPQQLQKPQLRSCFPTL
jgi:hypothetical protein